MPAGRDIEAAAAVLRAEVPDDGIPPVATVLDAVERFAAIAFDVPDTPDGDGFLFQYGAMSTYAEGAFLIGLVRQFAVEDDEGELDCYVQVQCEFQYPPEADLTAVTPYHTWWFAGGEVSFGDWFTDVRADAIWRTLGSRSPSRFRIWQEEV